LTQPDVQGFSNALSLTILTIFKLLRYLFSPGCVSFHLLCGLHGFPLPQVNYLLVFRKSLQMSCMKFCGLIHFLSIRLLFYFPDVFLRGFASFFPTTFLSLLISSVYSLFCLYNIFTSLYCMCHYGPNDIFVDTIVSVRDPLFS
jgi:hypothetical protein